MYNWQTCWYYFIRYPLCAGGTHLANLLSLDNEFQPRLGQNRDKYFEQLEQKYLNSHGHIENKPGTALISDPPAKHALSNQSVWQKSVHLGHAASFDWASKLLDPLAHKRYILMQFNSQESREFIRERERKIFGSDTLANSYYAAELAHFYNVWFSESDACDDDINFAFECHRMTSSDISPLVAEINSKFQLNIPIDQAQKLHNLWLTIL